MLKEISQINDIAIVFKGGTSLSKCYDIIDRFSEDIDLAVSFEGNRLNDRKRKKLKKSIKSVITKLGFNFLNEQNVESNKEYNKYEVGYNKLFNPNQIMVDHIIIETLVVYKPYPCEKRKVSNYITKYLEKNGQNDIIQTYNLDPFDMMIQTIDRTFIDKIFAICDYHLLQNYVRHSRHIYDLYKILHSGLLNTNIVRQLMDDVIKDRQLLGIQNISCSPGQKPNEVLKELFDNNVYEMDYNEITLSFVYKPIDYKEAIKIIKIIIEEKLLPGVIEKYND